MARRVTISARHGARPVVHRMTRTRLVSPSGSTPASSAQVATSRPRRSSHIVWIGLNAVAWSLRWDKYPFILLNLAFSTQAAYAAPLILLAQNRQTDRDRAEVERDREMNSRALADTEYLAREIAGIRLTLDTRPIGRDRRDRSPDPAIDQPTASSTRRTRTSVTALELEDLAGRVAATAASYELWCDRPPLNRASLIAVLTMASLAVGCGAGKVHSSSHTSTRRPAVRSRPRRPLRLRPSRPRRLRPPRPRPCRRRVPPAPRPRRAPWG